MGLGEKAKKFFLKLGLSYLPWVAVSSAFVYSRTNLVKQHAEINRVESYSSVQDTNNERLRIFLKIMLPVYASVAGFCLLGAYGTYLSRKKRVLIEEHTGIDRIFSQAGISSVIGTAGVVSAVTIAGTGQNDSFLNYWASRDPAIFGSYVVSTCAFVGPIFYSLFSNFSNFKSPSIKNWFKSLKCVVDGSPKNLSSVLGTSAYESDLSLADRAKICFSEGRRLDALYYWNASLQFKKRKSSIEQILASNSFEKISRNLTTKLLLSRNTKSLKENPDDVGLLVQKQFLHMLGFQYDNAVGVSKKVLSLPQCTDEDRILQSFVLDSLGEEKFANEVREGIFNKLFMDRAQMKVGGGLLYSKIGKRARLEGEAELLRGLQRHCEKHNFEAARPLSILGEGNDACLFETFSDGTRLYDYLESNPDIKVLHKAALTQAALHNVVPAAGYRGIDDDISSFVRNAPLEDKEELDYALHGLLQPIWSYQAADCDGHRENRHLNTAGQITVYDLERRGRSPPASDYAKLFWQGRWVGTWKDQEKILVECAEKYNQTATPVCRIPEKAFPEHVLRACPYKALRFAVFVKNKPERHVTALQFLGNAENCLHLLRETSVLSPGICNELQHAIENTSQELITSGASIPPRTFH